jgi:hypothetical protein
MFMSKKEEFIEIYKKNIYREGSNNLLDYLTSEKSDFFTAPASTKFHNSYEGGLLEHSINTFYCLKDYLSRKRINEVYHYAFNDESITIVSLLHDICKINCYQQSFRNIKDQNGTWIQTPIYEYEDELPYGHGEKSVYIISGYMKLSREEAFAIRFHMGFSRDEDKRNISNTFERFPLALALSIADMEATYFMRNRISN